MSEIESITQKLEVAARRLHRQRVLKGVWQGLMIGTATWLVAMLLQKVLPLPVEFVWGAGGLAILSLIVGAVSGWRQKPRLMQVARIIDDKQGLNERLSTALELQGKGEPTPWTSRVVNDAATKLEVVDEKQLFPWSLPEVAKWTCVLMAVSAGLGFLPEYRTPAQVAKKKDAEVIKEAGKQLTELVKRNLQARPPVMEPTQKSLEQAAELGERLQSGNLSKSDALKDLAKATDKLKQETRQLMKDPAMKKLEEAARTASNPNPSQSEALQKQIDAMKKAIEDGKNADADALDRMKRDLDKVQEMAKSLNDKDAAAANAAKENIQQAMGDLAKQARDLGLSLPNLNDAMEALAASQIDQFMKDLKMTEIDLEKLKSLAKTIQQAQQMTSKAGKDLAEQLKFGQADAARESLSKMIDKLKQANLSEEELKKLESQVAEAVEPGKQVGKVGEKLAKALQAMKSGSKEQGAENLAAASKELEEMMQQLADAESLMATLDAMERASTAISSGEGWKQAGKGRGGAGKGKGTGKGGGFGTWHDENSWEIPEFSETWDNSGQTREDMEAKGITDRGEGALADNLAPTKVRGQITPGGPMPSITLKGVSIKGQSRVGYTESSTSSQSDAQSALNQDQVPRAYQGAVKDYFDDVKR